MTRIDQLGLFCPATRVVLPGVQMTLGIIWMLLEMTVFAILVTHPTAAGNTAKIAANLSIGIFFLVSGAIGVRSAQTLTGKSPPKYLISTAFILNIIGSVLAAGAFIAGLLEMVLGISLPNDQNEASQEDAVDDEDTKEAAEMIHGLRNCGTAIAVILLCVSIGGAWIGRKKAFRADATVIQMVYVRAPTVWRKTSDAVVCEEVDETAVYADEKEGVSDPPPRYEEMAQTGNQTGERDEDTADSGIVCPSETQRRTFTELQRFTLDQAFQIQLPDAESKFILSQQLDLDPTAVEEYFAARLFGIIHSGSF